MSADTLDNITQVVVLGLNLHRHIWVLDLLKQRINLLQDKHNLQVSHNTALSVWLLMCWFSSLLSCVPSWDVQAHLSPFWSLPLSGHSSVWYHLWPSSDLPGPFLILCMPYSHHPACINRRSLASNFTNATNDCCCYKVSFIFGAFVWTAFTLTCSWSLHLPVCCYQSAAAALHCHLWCLWSDEIRICINS